jgi:hypothetical protein
MNEPAGRMSGFTPHSPRVPMEARGAAEGAEAVLLREEPFSAIFSERTANLSFIASRSAKSDRNMCCRAQMRAEVTAAAMSLGSRTVGADVKRD